MVAHVQDKLGEVYDPGGHQLHAGSNPEGDGLRSAARRWALAIRVDFADLLPNEVCLGRAACQMGSRLRQPNHRYDGLHLAGIATPPRVLS